MPGQDHPPSQPELKWLYEHLVEQAPLLRRLPTRRSVLVQLLIMELLALACVVPLRVGPEAAVAGSLVVLAVALWSELLLTIAPALRVPLPPLSGEAARVIHRYRAWMFHRRHAEAVVGGLIWGLVMVALLRPRGAEGRLLDEFLGPSSSPARAAVQVLVVLLAWDVCYRQGVALWVGALSAWRSWRLSQAELTGRPADRPRPEWLYHFRRMDRRLLWFPAANVLLLPAAVHDPALLGLVVFGSAVVVAALGVALAYDELVWARTPAALAPRSVRGIRQRRGGEHRVQWPDPDLYPRLPDRAHAAIIGAGPAGTFAVHFLRAHARRMGLDLRLTIFDAKDFTQPGPLGCNMCGGVVVGTLLKRMREAGLEPPPGVVQSVVDGFQLDMPTGTVRLHHPDPEEQMATVFRGGGPRGTRLRGNVSFDDFLLEAVRGPDLELVTEPVTGLEVPADVRDPIRVAYGRGERKRHLEADVVLGAFGVGGRLARHVEELGLGYRRPRTVIACQAELFVGAQHIRERLHGDIHVLNLGLPHVAFVALVPKGDFLTFTMVGYRDLGLSDLHAALDHPAVRAKLPPDWEIPQRFCHCHPRVVVRGAAHPYAHRLVVIGDAACSRLYKNGLESAFNTAAFAAHTIIHRGVSAEAFEEHYLPPCRRVIMNDNRYGELLFRMNHGFGGHPTASRALLSLVDHPDPRVVQRVQEAMWGLFAGSLPYRYILKRAAHPRVTLALLGRMVGAMGRPPEAPAGHVAQ